MSELMLKLWPTSIKYKDIALSDYISSSKGSVYRPLPDRSNLEERIKKLSETAGKDGWDGPHSLSVSADNIFIAGMIAKLLPSSAPTPDSVYVTALGEITLSWNLSRNNMLGLGISPEGKVSYAGVSKIKGSEKWAGNLPSPVQHFLEGIPDYFTGKNE